jgi:hypothetical protein
MKRKLLAIALIGISVVAFRGPAFAHECKQVDPKAAMDCREIPARDLGPRYCLLPESFGLRAIKSKAAPSHWVTNNPIELGSFEVNPPPSAKPCARTIDLIGYTLNIARTGDHYYVSMSNPKLPPIAFDASVSVDHGNDLWLSGTDPGKASIHYFVYFRDRSPDAKLPKFLFVEALDYDDGECKDNAPALASTVKKLPCAEPVPHSSSLTETGVGAGGEHP